MGLRWYLSLTPEQVRRTMLNAKTEGEAEALRLCDWCGEPLGESPRAEIWRGGESITVHQEPCATRLLQEGWKIA